MENTCFGSTGTRAAPIGRGASAWRSTSAIPMQSIASFFIPVSRRAARARALPQYPAIVRRELGFRLISRSMCRRTTSDGQQSCRRRAIRLHTSFRSGSRYRRGRHDTFGSPVHSYVRSPASTGLAGRRAHWRCHRRHAPAPPPRVTTAETRSVSRRGVATEGCCERDHHC